MAEEKIIIVGDSVKIQTADKIWEGTVLESPEKEIIFLKLNSGYNIGLKAKDIISAETIKKADNKIRKKLEFSHNKNLKNIAIIITGGTISARFSAKTGGVIPTDVEEILNIAPELNNICNIVKVENPFMKFSEDMSFLDWKKIAEKSEELLNDEQIDGIIITHGTDFIHYSASALSFMLGKLNKPVALTYSQRSIDRASTDAHLNLICAAHYAISDIAEVALVGHKNLEDEFCLAMPGTKTKKMHTSRRDTFKVVNSTPFAIISEEQFRILRGFNPRSKNKVKVNTQYSDKVALIKVVPGQEQDILDFYEDKGYRGIIMEVAGIGQVPGKNATVANWIPRIKKMIEKGIIICATAQTTYGRLNPYVYENGRELEKTGILFLEDMLSETAFVKLSWLLGQKSLLKKPDEIKKKMLENISNEFNKNLTI